MSYRGPNFAQEIQAVFSRFFQRYWPPESGVKPTGYFEANSVLGRASSYLKVLEFLGHLKIE
jgi:hypothetical protein